MNACANLPIFLFLFQFMFMLSVHSKSTDLYKVLGVEKNASQREIQKAFHKLSLQYHPDKNKNKGAQEKFAEINNAYDILSDEDKRKNYDLYGDEKGTPGFDGGNGGYTHFTSSGPGPGGFSFRPDEWQNMGGQGGQKSFSFSFGGPSSHRSFGFGLDDMFSNLFGGDMGGGSQFGGFGGSARSQPGSKSFPKSISSVDSQVYKKEIAGKGVTWLLLSYTPSTKGTQYFESIIGEVANSLQGVIRVGSINCEAESYLCKELKIFPRRTSRLFVYSYKASDTGSWIEYNGDQTVKSLKSFCQDNLPKFSRRVNLGQFDPSAGTSEPLPKVMLLSTKKDTPVIWRALSGLYGNRFLLFDAEVHDVSDPALRKLGINALPAVVGWLSNGEKHILKTGISVKDMKSAIADLSTLLDGFEKKNKKTASQSQKSGTDAGDKQIPIITGNNFEAICGEKTPVCLIGAFRSTKGRKKLENILSSVSRKSLSRRWNRATSVSESISYALLDASKQSSFLNSLDKSGFKSSSDKLMVAYKPKRGKLAAFLGEITEEEVEKFIGSVLNGDVQFTNIRQKPTFK